MPTSPTPGALAVHIMAKQKQMQYKKVTPYKELEAYIQFYWELKGNERETQRERVFPDGCAGIVMNLGDSCLTDNGTKIMEFGKTYIVGAMTLFKDSFIKPNSHLIGVCVLNLQLTQISINIPPKMN